MKCKMSRGSNGLLAQIVYYVKAGYTDSSRIRDAIVKYNTDPIHATLLSSATRSHPSDAERKISFHGSKNKGELAME